MTYHERRYNIWFIEDNLTVINQFRSMAESHGIVVLQWIQTYAEALQAIKNFDPKKDIKPDVLLIDGDLKDSNTANHDGEKLVIEAKKRDFLTLSNTTTEINAEIKPGRKVFPKELRTILNEHFLGSTSSQT